MSFQWIIGATGNGPISYDQALNDIGYPNCVNPTYGLMSSQCMINALAKYGLPAAEAWVTFDQAYAIMEQTTGTINPTGMYHFMGMRGIQNGQLWVANSAQGYKGVYEHLTRNQYNSLGPTKLIYLT